MENTGGVVKTPSVKEGIYICMISAAVNKDFGVLAADSATYTPENKEIKYETGKLSLVRNRYLMAFVGTNLYFPRMDWKQFDQPLKHLSIYLQGYLREIRPDVGAALKQDIKDEDDSEPHFCLYILGVHNQHPTLVQLNSFKDFAPRYLWSDNGLKFSTMLYGDNNPGKQKIFKESTKHMVDLSNQYETHTPGLVGEILTRGIYKKADLETEIGDKRKYAGGIVNAAYMSKTGLIQQLSGLEVIYGTS